MNRFILSLVLMLLCALNIFAQEITEFDTDKIYVHARREYSAGNFEISLAYTQRGLELAPEYHDIRILQVRNLLALEQYESADEDLDYLLQYAPNYIDVPPLVQQRINHYKQPQVALAFLEKVVSIYPHNNNLKIKQADLLIKMGRTAEAREIAKQLIGKNISGAERYLLQNILTRTVRNRIGLNYQYIHFSEDYSRNEPWHTVSLEYQRNFSRTAVIGRITFSNRQYDQGIFYEIEAYPVFNDRFYTFVNLGFSDSPVFPEFRGSFSFYYNFAKVFEAEAGSRIQSYGSSSYFTGIGGLTFYTGKFYFNTRIFLGPERNEQLIQNYQFNTRYYLKNAENYLFLRAGNGISPDETSLSTLQLEDPTLDAWYGNLGINKTIGIHHTVQVSTGLLHEEITAHRSGTQVLGNIGYYYSF